MDFSTKKLQPPTKKIAFNRSLNTNDGLLISLIAKDEHISYKQAELKINDFVMQCEKNLQINGSILFEGIGKVYIDDSKNLQFNPSSTFTSFTSYGLGEIPITPVNRIKEMLIESIGDKPAETYEDEIAALRQKRKFRIWPFRISAILAAAFVFSSLLMNIRSGGNQYDKASLFPVQPSVKYSNTPKPTPADVSINTPEVTTAVNIEPTTPVLSTPTTPIITPQPAPVKQEIAKQAVSPMVETTVSIPSTTIDKAAVSLTKPSSTVETVKENTSITPQPSKPEVNTMSTVVVGSFSNKANAENYQMQLLTTGYKPYVAGANNNYRVCIAVNDTDLDAKLAKIRSDINANAWVIEKK